MGISSASLAISLGMAAWNVYLNVSARKETLSIAHRDRSAVANFVEQLQEYLTVFCIDILIVNTSQTKTLTIADYRLAIPWKDDDLRPLPDPEEIGEPGAQYRFPCSELSFRRTDVLNHRRFVDGVIEPGKAIAGLLLFQGTAQIASNFYGPRPVPVTVIVVDVKGRKHKSESTCVMPVKSFQGVPEPPPPGIRID